MLKIQKAIFLRPPRPLHHLELSKLYLKLLLSKVSKLEEKEILNNKRLQNKYH
jgi:hypothetical protein